MKSTSLIDVSVGSKVGTWTILGRDFDHPKGKMYMFCRCDCGTERSIQRSALRRGASTKCVKCAASARHIPIPPGSVFNSWTVIESKREGTEIKYHCRCKCGNESIVPRDNLLKGRSTRCKNCNNRKYVKGVYSLYWSAIKKSAENRNFEFSIDKDETEKLLEKQEWKCTLSGLPIHFSDWQDDHKRGGSTASLDRIDSSKGYISGNVQWVHKVVNNMKMDLDEKEFIAFCCSVAKNQIVMGNSKSSDCIS